MTNQYNSMNYLLGNNTNLFKDNNISTTPKKPVVVTPIYDEDINIKNKVNSNIQSPLKKISNISSTSPEKKNDISMADILTNYNYEKTCPKSTSNKNENLNIPKTTIYENKDKNRARSPEFSRKNNFLNNNEPNSISTFYSRSPGPSINRQRDTSPNYNEMNYTQYQFQNSLNNNNNLFYHSTPNKTSTRQSLLMNNISPYSYTRNVSAFNDNSSIPNLLNNNQYTIEPNLIYPSASNHIDLTNLTSDIQLNADGTQLYDNSNIIPSSVNNITYLTSSPYSPSTENFLNNIDSNTYQTIENIPLNETVSNNTNYIYQVNNDNTITYIPSSINQDSSNILYTDYIVTPSKENQIQYIIPDYNNNLNLSPSSNNLMSNYTYQNPISTYQTKYYTDANYSHYVNQYSGLINPHYNSSSNKNNYSIQRQISTPIISNFNSNNNNLKHKKKLSSSIYDDESESSSNTQTNNFTKKKINSKSLKKSSNNKINNYRPISLELRPDEYFTQYMFDQINQIRVKPQSFIPKIKNGIKKITYDKRGNLIYKGKLKVALYKGQKAFIEAISDLNEIDPMDPLVFKKELCVDISNIEKEFKSGDYLRQKINEKINDGITIRAFWRDIIKDPEINFLLMIVDDNPIKRGDKRKDILDPEMKYIGINSGYLGNNFVCYTVLSDE